MPYEISWHQPHQIIFIKITGKFSEEEMFEHPTIIRDQYLSDGEAPVHLILDIFDITEYPRNIAHIQKATSIFMSHPSMGWIILVGFDNPVARFVANVSLQLFGKRFGFAMSMDEAMNILTKVDQRLRPTETPPASSQEAQ